MRVRPWGRCSMVNLSETEKAYLAGIFDGEGTVGYYPANGSHTIYVQVTNTDSRVINWVKNLIPGGFVKTRKRHVNRKPVWEWLVRDRDLAIEVLNIIRPYLIIKADQVDLLLSLMNDERILRGDSKRFQKLSPEIIEHRTSVEMQMKALKTVVH